MAATKTEKRTKFPLKEKDILPIERATDIHPHTSYTDGELHLIESISEAYQDDLYEKGAIEHGNPLDEDIDHPTTFLHRTEWEDRPYTDRESYTKKFENIREITADIDGATPLTDADPDKIRRDLTIIKNIHDSIPELDNTRRYLEIIENMNEKLSESKNISEYGSEELLELFNEAVGSSEVSTPSSEDVRRLLETGRELGELPLNSSHILDDGLNYSLVVPHGVELDYNPAIETADNNKHEAVDSYENALIDFLKQAESANSGYNYVLLSSHYVNTPFKPRYVKQDCLFEGMSHEEIGEVLESYREKEVTKIGSLASKLSDMSVPRTSEELMDKPEKAELQKFIYGLESISEVEGRQEDKFISEKLGLSLDIERPGIFAVGAHPTLIERNEEFMDYFRGQEGLTTKEEIMRDLDRVMKADIEKQDVDDFLGDEAISSLYPEKALEEFYKPMVEAANSEDNFIFEINGKGVERQFPSIFWEMLDENVFGSDSHRPGEQSSRSREFNEMEIPSETTLLVDKWVSQLED